MKRDSESRPSKCWSGLRVFFGVTTDYLLGLES